MLKKILIVKPCGEMWFNAHIDQLFEIDHIDSEGHYIIKRDDGISPIIFANMVEQGVAIVIDTLEQLEKHFEVREEQLREQTKDALFAITLEEIRLMKIISHHRKEAIKVYNRRERNEK